MNRKLLSVGLTAFVCASFLGAEFSEARAVRVSAMKFDGDDVKPPTKESSRVLQGLRSTRESYAKVLETRRVEIEAELDKIKAEANKAYADLLAADKTTRSNARAAKQRFDESQAKLKSAQRKAEAARDRLAKEIEVLEKDQAEEKVRLIKSREGLGRAKAELGRQYDDLTLIGDFTTNGAPLGSESYIGTSAYQDAQKSVASASTAVKSAEQNVKSVESWVNLYKETISELGDQKTDEMAKIVDAADQLTALDQRREVEVAKIREEQRQRAEKYRESVAQRVAAYQKAGGDDANKRAPAVPVDGIAFFPADSAVELSAKFKNEKGIEKARELIANQRDNDLYAELMYMDMDQLKEELKDNKEIFEGLRDEILGVNPNSKSAFKRTFTGLAVLQMFEDFCQKGGCSENGKNGIKAQIEDLSKLNSGDSKTLRAPGRGSGSSTGGAAGAKTAE